MLTWPKQAWKRSVAARYGQGPRHGSDVRCLARRQGTTICECSIGVSGEASCECKAQGSQRLAAASSPQRQWGSTPIRRPNHGTTAHDTRKEKEDS